MDTISENKCFGGVQGVYRHTSSACSCPMTFGLFMPPQAANGPVPLLWYLSGLTCTHENAMVKAGAQGWAAERGIAVVFPDTSPRGEGVADDAAYDLGQGAGFYVDATQTPWTPHYRMRSYILDDLPALLFERFALDPERQGITGHSMGGHGALTLALTNPDRFRSLSAFAPIANPSGSDWGRKQFAAYLGPDENTWIQHDASALLRSGGWTRDMLIDQGGDDQFLNLLRFEKLGGAVSSAGVKATLRLQPGYDHSYFFIATFMREHVSWHADRLGV